MYVGDRKPPGGKNRVAVQKSCGSAQGKPRSEDAFKEDRLDLCELKSRKGPPRWSNFLILRTENPDLVSLIDLRTVSTMASGFKSGSGGCDQDWLLFSEVRLGQSRWGPLDSVWGDETF